MWEMTAETFTSKTNLRQRVDIFCWSFDNVTLGPEATLATVSCVTATRRGPPSSARTPPACWRLERQSDPVVDVEEVQSRKEPLRLILST